MSDGGRLDVVEERLMQLQREIEALDAALRDEVAARDELARRLARLEARLARGDEADEAAGDAP